MVELALSSPNAGMFLESWVEELQSSFRQEVNILPEQDLYKEAMELAARSILHYSESKQVITYYEVIGLKPFHDSIIRNHLARTKFAWEYGNSVGMPDELNIFKFIFTTRGYVAVKRLEESPER